MSGPIDGYTAAETGADVYAEDVAERGPGDADTSALDSGRLDTATITGPYAADSVDTDALSLGPVTDADRVELEADGDGARDIPRQAGMVAVSVVTDISPVVADVPDTAVDSPVVLPTQQGHAPEVDVADPIAADDEQQSWRPDNTYQVTGRYEGDQTSSSIAGGGTNETMLSGLDSDQLRQHAAWAEDLERQGNGGMDSRATFLAAMRFRTTGAQNFLERYREPQHQAFQERRTQLERLDYDGFNRGQINELRDIVAASGLPTRGLTSFVHGEARDLEGGGGQVIASMHTHGPDAGRFTVYDCFDQAPMEEKKATVVHEMVHNLSALREENNEVFGEGEAGEQERLAVAEYVSRVVDQSLVTGVHLNGYHKHLMEEYNNTKRILEACLDLDPEVQGQHITPEEYDEYLAQARYKLTEETQAILTEMSFFKRAELERVQGAQASKLYDLARIAAKNPDSELLPESVRGHGVDGLPQRVDLITNPEARGDQAPGVGADRIAITLLRDSGVANYDDLMRHIDDFKGIQWGNRSPRVRLQHELELQERQY